MTNTLLAQKRQKRLIAIAVAIVLLVSLAAWWYWPRVDQRFVGKWQMTLGPDVYFLELKADGTGREYVNGLAANVPFTWSVYNETLFFSVYPSGPPILFSRVQDLTANVQGLPMPWSTFQQVEEVTSNRLSLLRSPSHYQRSFTRIAW